jgi:hypothetical protein
MKGVVLLQLLLQMMLLQGPCWLMQTLHLQHLHGKESELIRQAPTSHAKQP